MKKFVNFLLAYGIVILSSVGMAIGGWLYLWEYVLTDKNRKANHRHLHEKS